VERHRADRRGEAAGQAVPDLPNTKRNIEPTIRWWNIPSRQAGSATDRRGEAW
jgi:hypothetical protein